MEKIGIQDITCPSCHSEKFTVINNRIGQLSCDFCHNQWTDTRFVKVPLPKLIIREYTRTTPFQHKYIIEELKFTYSIDDSGEIKKHKSSSQTIKVTDKRLELPGRSKLAKLPKLAKIGIALALFLVLFIALIAILGIAAQYR
jgi:hypothetical protein